MGKEIGIDLGTTNTVVSYINRKGKLKSFKFEGKNVIPSAVYFLSEDEWEVGYIAKNKGIMNPKAYVDNFKSNMGDKKFKYPIVAENGDKFKVTARDVAKYFLSSIIKKIENKLIKEFGDKEGVVEKVIITVPAKFSSTEKEATKWSAIEAGFENVMLLAEPTAAAIAHQRECETEGKTVLVYDFGGGTFDVSVLKESNGIFKEIATGGDKKLGGNTLTRKIMEFILKIIEDDYELYMPLDEDDFDEDDSEISLNDYKSNMFNIFQEANSIKEDLSTENEREIIIDIKLPNNENKKVELGIIKRSILESLIKEYIDETIKITSSVIEEVNNEGIEKIDEIVLAGGSSQIPMVKNELEKALNQKIIFADDVSTLISRGAAILASMNYNNGITTTAKTNVELGLEVNDGVNYNMFEMLIPVNQELPYKCSREYSLSNDNQETVEIKIFERDIKNYPKSKKVFQDGIEEIDKLIISNLPKNLKKNDVKIIVNFVAEKDGSLNVDVDIRDVLKDKSIKNDSLIVNKESNLE